MNEQKLRRAIREMLKEDWWSDMSSYDQQKYIKDHPGSDKAKSSKKSKKDKEDKRKKLTKKDYEVDAATGKAVKKKEKKKEDPKKKDKHVQAIKKGMFPGSKEYKKFMAKNESINEDKFSKQQLNKLKSSYGSLKTMNPSSPIYKKFIKFLEKLPKNQLKQLADADIKFISMLAKNRIKESINEATEFIAIYNRKKIIVKGDSLYDAKLQAIKQLKVPKSKQGYLSIMSKKGYDDQQFRYENINEAKVPKNIKISKQGYVKQVRHPMTNKILKAIYVGENNENN